MSNLPFGFTPPDPDDEAGGQGHESFSMADLGTLLSQLGAMMQGTGQGADTGPVNWSAAEDVARRTIAASGDRVVADAQRRSVEQAVRLADLWLDPVTTFPTTAGGARAWSRAEWLAATLPAWREIITPVAEQVQASMESLLPSPADLAEGLPEELRAMLPANLPVDFSAMLGPLLGMAKQMGAGMFAMQAGQGLAALAEEVLGASDVGLPLVGDAVPTLLPENVAAFGAGLGIEDPEIVLYLALREVAHQRVFAHVPWLGPTVRGAVAEYAHGIGLDGEAMQEALSGIDINDPAAIQQALASGVLAPQDTPEQKAALARLETLLALTEGWVDHVVTAASKGRLASGGRLQEAVRRRRAVGGPAEKTFSTLVGLELRPRRLREAARLWSLLEQERGVEGRDAVWAHPDLLPGPADLDDPEGFVSGSRISDADLAALTDGTEAEEAAMGAAIDERADAASAEADTAEVPDVASGEGTPGDGRAEGPDSPARATD